MTTRAYPTVIFALLLSGCATVGGPTSARNPAFASEGPLEGPTIQFEPIHCQGDRAVCPHEPGHEPGPSARVFCAALSKDELFYEDLFLGNRWAVEPKATQLVQETAEATRAAAVVVPVVRSSCEGSSNPPAISTVASSSEIAQLQARDFSPPALCADGPKLSYGTFVFDPKGRLIWKATGALSADQPERLDEVLGQALTAAPIHPTALAAPSSP